MKFIDMIFVLYSIAERIELQPDPNRCKIFVPAGKISQSSATELHERVAPELDVTDRVSKAARKLNEALNDSECPKPKLFELDPERKVPSPADIDAWSRLGTMLLQAMFWNIREKRYCLEHFLKATVRGESFLRGPIQRHETEDWLSPNGNALRRTSLGFDSDEIFTFLDANSIQYKPSV